MVGEMISELADAADVVVVAVVIIVKGMAAAAADVVRAVVALMPKIFLYLYWFQIFKTAVRQCSVHSCSCP